jgi:3-oxoacyl-[acyl-carrier-protein] synthase-3
MTVSITGYGVYVPPDTVTGPEIAERSGVPADVVVEKMGIKEKHVCQSDADHVTDMGVKAARTALADAEVDATDLDLVCYHGSEYKDYIVWSAAADIAHRLGAQTAYAQETYALCAGTPITLRQVGAQIASGDVRRALLIGASREEDLVDYTDQDASFMFNFGSGASAYVLESEAGDRTRAELLGHDSVTDGSFSRDVIMPAGGSRRPPTHETIDETLHTLTVPDPDDMGERLGEVTLDNFLAVTDGALGAADLDRADLDYVALTHMKRSFYETLLEELGLSPAQSHYLDEYGHVQSVDQALALEEGLESGAITEGDVVLFLAAGTGYTWAASVLRWEG